MSRTKFIITGPVSNCDLVRVGLEKLQLAGHTGEYCS